MSSAKMGLLAEIAELEPKKVKHYYSKVKAHDKLFKVRHLVDAAWDALLDAARTHGLPEYDEYKDAVHKLASNYEVSILKQAKLIQDRRANPAPTRFDKLPAKP